MNLDKNEQLEINKAQMVKAYQYGSTLEMTTATGLQPQTIRVISGKRYVVLATGEIKDMNVSNALRSDNLKSVKLTMRKLRRIIDHNFKGGQNELWITLTYANYVTDPKVAYTDFKLFMTRLKRLLLSIEYISVIEPQASGRWHFHLLLKSVTKLVIPNDVVSNLWRQGFTKTKRLRQSDKVGNYLMAYLTDLEIPDSEDSTKKKYVKGTRLMLYPKGIRIYRAQKVLKIQLV